MPTRKLMIYIHLVIAAVFLPLMLIMPLTGSLYIFGFTGDQEKVESFRVQAQVPEEAKEKEDFFRDLFRRQGIDFDFEYIRGTKTDFIFRPATRVHYVATKDGETLVVSKVTPTLLKRLIELHKGHGPTLMRWYEAFFGIALILVTLSGLWLAWTVKPYRKATLISFGIGVLVIALCLI